jgi:phosphatidylinositol 3-kinase
LDPEVLITGCIPDQCSVFKSSLSPLLINFKLSNGESYPVIFKVGDDLRQDQLVIQIISLMDRLLRKENLDLKLTPYRIIATGATAGAVQFIPSTSLSAATAKYRGSLLAYLKANNPDENEPLGIRKEAMDTYIKSCAGYCVITYLLGVGDRHLENLLLAPDGHFFHADFGFILGRDPKPFAPMMKLCKEMVEGMGGAASPNYIQFKQYCFTAYTTLRKSANLILNLFSLMVDANIPDIRLEPDKAVLKVKERFHLELTEEEAIRHFEQLISDSVNAIFGVVIDRLHDFVQGWRA